MITGTIATAVLCYDDEWYDDRRDVVRASAVRPAAWEDHEYYWYDEDPELDSWPWRTRPVSSADTDQDITGTMIGGMRYNNQHHWQATISTGYDPQWYDYQLDAVRISPWYDEST